MITFSQFHIPATNNVNRFLFSFSLADVVILGIISTITVSIYTRRFRITAKRTVEHDTVIPDPQPLLEFDLSTARTRNHLYVNKTVRYPYYQTMAHQPMHINDWIEIDSDYTWYLEEKRKVILEQGKTVIDSLPENDEACNELLETLIDWLPKRYPTLFERIGDDGILNNVTSERFLGLGKMHGVDALKIISRLVQDDFLMARERPDGQTYFVGGLVAFPGFYLLSEKINMSIRETHAPVPYFNEKLLKSVERTLKRFEPHEPFERTSWEIVDDRNLFLHGISKHQGKTIGEAQHPRDLFFRVDHQTFRKLPRTKAIVFGVHPIMKRLGDLADSPLVPALLAQVHKESESILMNYKLAPQYQGRVLPYLQELHESQIQNGLIQGNENILDFRSLVANADHPSRQTSLQFPTESELRLKWKLDYSLF